ncbi:MAG: hypothetical protein IJW30_06915, partial [Clostridia bacterium]|nr:hypothetical protein [Clostridia bacterium]
MKHRLTYFLSVATVMLLCVVMLCGTVTPAAAQTQVAAASAFPSLQYGVEDEDKNTVLSATDLYERLFGKSPTEAESLYLESTGISFTYHSGIPANTNISTDYSGEDGVLLVTIRPYVFTAVNGSTVTWTPVSALIDGVRYVPEATEDVYTCRVENLFYSEDFDIKVDYTWSTEVPAVIIEEMRTAAYEKGNAALEANRAYESALKAYTEQLAAHEEWMAYQEWKPFWDAYLAKKAAYEAQCEAYETYCSNLEKYEEDLVKYEQWQEYFVYQDYLTNDLDDYNAYLLYQE